MSFAHLHCHSVYSLLDGYSNIKKLIRRTKEMGMPAVGLTDHGTMFGVIDFYNEAVKEGIKPIIGVEAYMANRGMTDRDPQYDKTRFHLLLLAQNETGYKNLLKISSAAQLEGFYYKPRIDQAFLAEHAEGLIATTGCMAGEVPQALLKGDYETARKKFDYYYDVFGPDNFFVELQDHDIKELPGLNKSLIELNNRYNVRYVATNDVHYVDESDARLQDVLLAIQTGTLLDDPKRMRMTDPSYHLRSPAEMEQLFGNIPGALSNTLLIAEKCELDLGFKGYHLPNFDVPDGETPQTYLRDLCVKGARDKYGDNADSEEVQNRLDYELGIIHEMGFDAYFLIVWDLCRHAADQGIWYTARGSAAGSIVAFSLRITTVDPLEHGLIFERFLNPGRISMPDIDLDFPDDRRAEMMGYCADRYGHDKVAQIITFGTLKARAAVRDVGRVMDIPLPEVDKVAKMIPAIPGKPVSIDEAIAQVPDLAKIYNTDARLRELLDTAKEMEGVVRNAGTHAAGVVVTDKPIIEYAPLHRPTSSGIDLPIQTVTQFEMSKIDEMGLLKIDFLGLVTLTVMAKACEFIKERHGVDFNLYNIPVTDEESFALMGRGDTAGVFQVEGTGMTRYILEMKPQNLDNVVAMIALYRPGPLEFIPSYIRRMHMEEGVSYLHPSLEPIFKETFGIAVYQEQIMRAAVDIAGYTNPEADDLRKAIAKKIQEKLIKHRKKFVQGAASRGVMPEATADEIFENWLEFARYGFNKCLPGDVEIVDYQTGRLIRIEDLYKDNQISRQTVSIDTESLKLQSGKILDVVDNGVKPVYQLTTALGRKIEATANHPFYTFNGWQILDELQEGNLIAVPRNLPIEGKAEWPMHEVVVLGHLLAEGNLCHPHSVYFYSQDADQVDDFVWAAEQFDNVECSIAVHKNTYSVYAKRSNRFDAPEIVTWAKTLDIWGKNATEKEIPAEVFELNNRQIGLLISRMWEGDGHINLTDRSLYYATSSERMARQLQHLLLRFGIISRLRTVHLPYKEGRIGYQLFITGNDNISIFSEKIASRFVNQKKHDQLISIVLDDAQISGTKDIVPIAVKQLVRRAKEESGVTWSSLNTETGIAPREFYPTNTPTKSGFTRKTIGRLAEYFDDSDLSKYADSDVYWDRIVSIEYVGEKQTYDLEIDQTHNFVANDILVHNSHAVAYGVIAVQTAYLKAHYPVEYMTATLSAYKGDTDRVALYVADCKRLGIEVEAPHIEHSGWDFTIEDRDGEPSVIRFGLGAVKNVGHGPVDEFMAARGEGPFNDLTDLARRVDLRAVGKRALEALIRVGALDHLGHRVAMLKGLERIVAVSASHFKAAEAGQMSLFGGSTALAGNIKLPEIMGEIDKREMLKWERDLIGLYVSDHPLTPYMDIFRHPTANITFSSELANVSEGQKVRVAGLVTRFRPHTTKSGKAMGFATVQDIQGNIELVIFPRTWDRYRDLIEVDKVLLVEGSADSDGKILVDTIGTEFKYLTSLDSSSKDYGSRSKGREDAPKPQAQHHSPSRTTSAAPRPKLDEPKTRGKVEEKLQEKSENLSVEVEASQARPLQDPTAPRKISEPPKAARTPQSLAPEEDLGPELFPEDWIMGVVIDPEVDSGDEVIIEPDLSPYAADTTSILPIFAKATDPIGNVKKTVNPAPPKASAETAIAADIKQVIDLPGAVASSGGQRPRPEVGLSSLGASLPYQDEENEGASPRHLNVVLRANSDKLRDSFRIQRIFNIIISYPGQDRFAFYMFEGDKSYLLDFPNFTTGICDELMDRLRAIVGGEQVSIEPIIYQ